MMLYLTLAWGAADLRCKTAAGYECPTGAEKWSLAASKLERHLGYLRAQQADVTTMIADAACGSEPEALLPERHVRCTLDSVFADGQN
jgi:hypothetical protein